jgi:hypothetical protein
MAFSDYKNISETQKEFGISYREENFLHGEPLLPSQEFLDELAFNRANLDIFSSETSRTELVISPLLRQAYRRFHGRYSFWIQKPMCYGEKLSGIPDYLFATKSPLGKTVLETPLVVIVEAKKNDFEQGSVPRRACRSAEVEWRPGAHRLRHRHRWRAVEVRTPEP